MEPVKLLTRKKRQFVEKGDGSSIHFSPFHFFPFERFQIIYRLNVKSSFLLALFFLFFRLGHKKRIVMWMFHPRFFWMTGVARLVFGNRLYVIYDCVDYFSLANPDEESKLRINEMKLLKHADLVVANSSVLANFHKKIRQDIQVVPLGFKLDEMAILPQKQDAPLVKKKFKTIGFIGAINYRIDFDLLTVLAKNNPHWKFVFIGPIYISDWDRKLATSRKITTLFSLSNVVLEKFSKSQKIYQEMADWSAAIIPYDLSLPLNQYCYPMKLMEYFYLGLPIVSVPIPSLLQYKGLIDLPTTEIAWQKSLEKVIKNGIETTKKNTMKNIAIQNSWFAKIDRIHNLSKE